MSHSPAHAPVWNRDIRRNSAPCFSKIVFACLAALIISSGLSLLKRVNCVIDIRWFLPSVFAVDERSQGAQYRRSIWLFLGSVFRQHRVSPVTTSYVAEMHGSCLISPLWQT